MIDFLRATLLLATTHFARILRTRRVLLCVLGATIPAAFAAFVQSVPMENPPGAAEVLCYPGWFIGLQILVPMASLLLGSAVITEEIDDRTITYLFTRPIPRASVLVGRWLATAVILSGVLALGFWGLGLAVELTAHEADYVNPEGLVATFAVAAVLGGLVYSAVFAALGTILKHPMIVGLGYAFAIEGFLANLPGKSQGLTVQHHIRSYVFPSAPEIFAELDNVNPEAMGAPADAVQTLVTLLALALALGSFVVSRRQYVLTS